MTITEWILVLTGAALLFAPVAAPSLRSVEDRKALLRDLGAVPAGHASSRVVCREGGCSIR
jgi:hypothetical protein